MHRLGHLLTGTRSGLVQNENHARAQPPHSRAHTPARAAHTETVTHPIYTHLFCFAWFSPLFCGLYPLPLVVRTLPSP